MTELPVGLHVGGNLHLEGSGVKEVPKTVAVDGQVFGLATVSQPSA